MPLDVKNDMSRIGLFSEAGYTTIGDEYVPSSKFTFNSSAYKDKQMLTTGSKKKTTGSSAGYFSDKFSRIFEQEAYSDPIGTRRRARMESSKKNITNKPFITFQGEKKPEGLGSTFGTFGGKVEYFSPKNVDKPKHQPDKTNFKTSPAKKGTGYGYVGVGIDKYPEYKSEKYDAIETLNKDNKAAHDKLLVSGPFKTGIFQKVFFDKSPFLNEKDSPLFKDKPTRSKSESELKPFKPSSPPKKAGNNKDGCFTKFPEHKPDPYNPSTDYKPSKRVVNKDGKLFVPQPGPKSRPQNSVINYNVNVKLNRSNYKTLSNFTTCNLGSAY